ncbi:HDOD domain-containing protein [Limnobacter parvus]|uniref:HDOD domain-containing protein n=1 Tax=Limnobacter parvus TaxID=2939690 RepID=A0ABT1XL48_9BURK|nr:HDOD domain-containing protein [Limnobacter parvus]MCR2747586.1 HDOD domain-containing protein [Limnobacter parvus]
MSNKFDAILQTAHLIPAIPKAVQDVLLLLNQNDLSINDLADAVRLDPVISAQVLKMANSAYFGRPKQVDCIEDAALIIGIDAIRTMVLACGLMGSWENTKNFDLQRFWRLSLLSAYIAKDIAWLYGHDANRAYTAALIHGLGVLAIHRAVPEIASEIDQACGDHFPYDRADAESQLLGFDHAEVSAAIAHEWNLPSVIGDSIRNYPHPGNNHSRELSALIHLSVALAINLSDDIPSDEWKYNLDVDVEDSLEILMVELPELQPKFDTALRFVNMMVTGR